MAKKKLRLFIIDDDEVNNFILIRLIKEEKIPVSSSSALNGKKALNKLTKCAEKNIDNYPDIILLDIDMPIMNGFEFLDVYEKTLYPRFPEVALYMVSSSIRSEDKLKSQGYESVTSFISKPMPLDTIKTIVSQYQWDRHAINQ